MGPTCKYNFFAKYLEDIHQKVDGTIFSEYFFLTQTRIRITINKNKHFRNEFSSVFYFVLM